MTLTDRTWARLDRRALARPLERAAHPVPEVDRRAPAELVARAGDVDGRALELAQAGRGHLGLEGPAAQAPEDLDDVVDARLPAGADVEAAASVGSARGE